MTDVVATPLLCPMCGAAPLMRDTYFAKLPVALYCHRCYAGVPNLEGLKLAAYGVNARDAIERWNEGVQAWWVSYWKDAAKPTKPTKSMKPTEPTEPTPLPCPACGADPESGCDDLGEVEIYCERCHDTAGTEGFLTVVARGNYNRAVVGWNERVRRYGEEKSQEVRLHRDPRAPATTLRRDVASIVLANLYIILDTMKKQIVAQLDLVPNPPDAASEKELSEFRVALHRAWELGCAAQAALRHRLNDGCSSDLGLDLDSEDSQDAE